MRLVRSHLSFTNLAGLLAVVLLALSLSAQASAGTISVTTTLDQLDGSAPCSLREAVDTANADANSGGCTDANPAAADTIKLAGGDYNLQRAGVEDANASGDLDVTESLAIVGDGADLSGIDGNGALTGDRVLQISAGTLTISGLTIHDGSPSNGGGGIQGLSGTTLRLINSTLRSNRTNLSAGGGISADIVTLTNSTVTGNTTNRNDNVFSSGEHGGGIFAGTATLTNSTVSGNTSGWDGGGIFAGTATLTNSTVSGNRAYINYGGGIFATTAKLTNSTVSDNNAGGRGGGIAGAGTLTDSNVRRNKAGAEGGGIDAEVGSLTVTRSTVADNDARNNAGGIFFSSPGTLNVTDSTLSGNESNGWGGALSTDEGTTNLRNATINRNVADADADGVGSGGGLDRFGAATVRLRNTILAGNFDLSASPEFPDWNCNGGVVSQGYNLLSSSAGCSVAPATGDQTAADPGLAFLANNGGPTPTQALLSTSPAINTGNPATPGSGGNACPATDQRGVPRALGGRCDKGAYERVSCHGKLVNRVGTGGADLLVGTSSADGILALGGNDVLRGGSGGDGLCGGEGGDQLFGEAGPDFLDGGGGTDTCDGGTESDQAVGCETRSSIP
jgi:CSLREA domain-containing protein